LRKHGGQRDEGRQLVELPRPITGTNLANAAVVGVSRLDVAPSL